MTRQEPPAATQRRRGLAAWMTVVAISVVAAVLVPFTILPLVAHPLATYLLWTGFSVVIAVFVIWGVASWRDP